MAGTADVTRRRCSRDGRGASFRGAEYVLDDACSVERGSVGADYPCRIESAAPRTRRGSRRHSDGREGRIDAGIRGQAVK